MDTIKKVTGLGMKLEIKNIITIDGQIETIKEKHDCQVKEKENNLYLIYKNEAAEKVIIKCHQKTLSINRFSNPHTIMTFERDVQHFLTIPTPMGIQTLITQTDYYQFEEDQQKVMLSYKLLQPESLVQFAAYHLEIKWS